MLLTKICMVGSGSADEAREQKELMEVMLLERMTPDVVCDGIVITRVAVARMLLRSGKRGDDSEYVVRH